MVVLYQHLLRHGSYSYPNHSKWCRYAYRTHRGKKQQFRRKPIIPKNGTRYYNRYQKVPFWFTSSSMQILTIETHTDRTIHLLPSQKHNRLKCCFVIQLNENHCVAIPHSHTSWEIGEFSFTYQATNLPHQLHVHHLSHTPADRFAQAEFSDNYL